VKNVVTATRIDLYLKKDSLIASLVPAFRHYNITRIACVTKDEKLIKAFPEYTSMKPSRKSVVLDMREGELPTVVKKVDINATWAAETNESIDALLKIYSQQKIVMLRKICPGYLRDGFRFFKFHSMHAFGMLLTNFPSLDRAYGIVDVGYNVKVAQCPLTCFSTDMIGGEVFKDTRKRTFAITNLVFGIDQALNLWGNMCKEPKAKDLRLELLQFDDDDTEMFQDADESEIRHYLAENGLGNVVVDVPSPPDPTLTTTLAVTATAVSVPDDDETLKIEYEDD
jgi:hypothetical protein